MNLISTSMGNDSIALIQWAHENNLEDCYVIYCDTGWAHPDWHLRVDQGMMLAESYGMTTWVIKTQFTFESIVLMKKGFPSNRYQWCSGLLKTIPFGEFEDFIDPNEKATVIIGKRRSESLKRSTTPEFAKYPEYHGNRRVWHPLYKHDDTERNLLLTRAAIEILPHRSMECCPCVNANRSDLQNTPETQIEKVRELEKSVNNYMFRAKNKQGAIGIDAVMEWANSDRGKYNLNQLALWNYRGLELCQSGMCGY